MKRRYRIFSVVLAVLLGLLSGCGDATAPSESPDDSALLEETGEAMTTSGVVAENAQYSLGWNEEKKAVYLLDKQTGRMWGTMPSELLQQTEVARGHALTQAALVVDYVEPNALGVTSITSTAGAVRQGRVLSYPTKDGLLVWYHFDELEISVPLTYQLLEDGLRVSCVPSAIKESENRVCAVELAPMMASVANDSADSWLFVPSGSGALIDVETAPSEKLYSEEVYGVDPSHNVLITRTNSRSVRLPVFGMKQGNDAMLGVISSGAATASVEAQAGNERVKYSSVYASFAIRGVETVEDAKVGAPRYIDIFSETKNSEELLAVDYYPLVGEQADYVGMAARYRQYLTQNGFKPQEITEQSLFLNVLGGTQLRKFFLGVPYRATTPLTTVEQVQTVLDAVSAYTPVNPVVKLIGFGDGGLETGKPAGGLTVDKAVGSEKDLGELIRSCEQAGTKLYMDFDLVYFSRSGSGVSRYSETAKAPNRQSVKQYPVHLAMRNPDTAHPAAYLLGHSTLQALTQQVIATAAEWGLQGVSFNSAGNTAYSDYGYADGAVKSGSDTRQGELLAAARKANLSVASSEANVYAALQSNHLFDVPLGHSMLDSIDTAIPFYEMVFKGSVPMGSEAVNMASDPHEMLLRAAESGCGLTYTVTGSFEKAFLNSAYTQLGMTYYEDQLELIAAQVGRIDGLLKQVAGAKIISHRIVGDLREVRYDNGVTVLVNYGDEAAATAYGEIAARDFQILAGEGNS